MRWRRRTDDVPARTLREAMDSLEWARVHDEPIPYTPVVLVDPPAAEVKRSNVIVCTPDELEMALALAEDATPARHILDATALVAQLRLVQGRA